MGRSILTNEELERLDTLSTLPPAKIELGYVGEKRAPFLVVSKEDGLRLWTPGHVTWAERAIEYEKAVPKLLTALKEAKADALRECIELVKPKGPWTLSSDSPVGHLVYLLEKRLGEITTS